MSEPRVPRVRQYHITLVLAGPEDSTTAWEAIRSAIEEAWKVNGGARESAGPGGTVLHGLFVKSGLLVKEAGREMLADEFAWRHQYPLLGQNIGDSPRFVRRKVPANAAGFVFGAKAAADAETEQVRRNVIELRGGFPPEKVREVLEAELEIAEAAWRKKHKCQWCAIGYGDCQRGYLTNTKCCAQCEHPTRWEAEPYTPEEIEQARADTSGEEADRG